METRIQSDGISPYRIGQASNSSSKKKRREKEFERIFEENDQKSDEQSTDGSTSDQTDSSAESNRLVDRQRAADQYYDQAIDDIYLDPKNEKYVDQSAHLSHFIYHSLMRNDPDSALPSLFDKTV